MCRPTRLLQIVLGVAPFASSRAFVLLASFLLISFVVIPRHAGNGISKRIHAVEVGCSSPTQRLPQCPLRRSVYSGVTTPRLLDFGDDHAARRIADDII